MNEVGEFKCGGPDGRAMLQRCENGAGFAPAGPIPSTGQLLRHSAHTINQ